MSNSVQEFRSDWYKTRIVIGNPEIVGKFIKLLEIAKTYLFIYLFLEAQLQRAQFKNFFYRMLQYRILLTSILNADL